MNTDRGRRYSPLATLSDLGANAVRDDQIFAMTDMIAERAQIGGRTIHSIGDIGHRQRC